MGATWRESLWWGFWRLHLYGGKEKSAFLEACRVSCLRIRYEVAFSIMNDGEYMIEFLHGRSQLREEIMHLQLRQRSSIASRQRLRTGGLTRIR